MFSKPSFMSTVQNAYLANSNNNIPPTNTFNQTMRGYPDVASFAENVVIVVSGSTFGVGGTSCVRKKEKEKKGII